MQTMTQWSSGDVDTNGVRIHFHRTGGANKPPLLLAHGATDSGLCWSRVARALEADFDVIMPDARGHGLSSAPDAGYTAADHAADLAGLIRALGLERPAVAGHSMGAGATLALIANYPELVSRAILEDPGFRLPDAGGAPTPGRDPRAEIRQTVRDAQRSDLAATMAVGRSRHPGWSEEEFETWARAKQQVSRQFLDSMGGRPIGAEWQELLPRVQCPVLLVTSDPELGSIVTPEAAAIAQQLLPSLRVVRLSGAGHNIRREQFAAFMTAIKAFLAE